MPCWDWRSQSDDLRKPGIQRFYAALSYKLERIPVKINFTPFIYGGLPIGETALRAGPLGG
jgi:hypothetical protein